MNKYSSISGLSQLYSEKLTLQKKVRKQEKAVLNDVTDIQNGFQKWVDGAFRVRNIARTLLPKLEYTTVLFPILKRILKRKRK